MVVKKNDQNVYVHTEDIGQLTRMYPSSRSFRIAEFRTLDDMYDAIDKLNDTAIEGAYIRVREVRGSGHLSSLSMVDLNVDVREGSWPGP